MPRIEWLNNLLNQLEYAHSSITNNNYYCKLTKLNEDD